MLTHEQPESPRDGAPRKPYRPRARWVAPLLVLVFLAVLMLRHDFWNFRSVHPLLFGFLPVGLWWQALVSISACLMMWLMVTLAWPGHLEAEAEEAERKRANAARDSAGDAK